jgi:hypothetical protein
MVVPLKYYTQATASRKTGRADGYHRSSDPQKSRAAMRSKLGVLSSTLTRYPRPAQVCAASLRVVGEICVAAIPGRQVEWAIRAHADNEPGGGLRLVRDAKLAASKGILGRVFHADLVVMTGLVLGTNSFVGMDLRGPLPFLAGTAQATTIGEAEMLGYILVTAATVKLGIYRRGTWRWNDRFARVGRLRDVRLEWAEWVALAMEMGLVIVAAWRES